MPLIIRTCDCMVLDSFSCPCITILGQSTLEWGALWLSGRVSDSGARGRGFETYRRRVVSLSKTLYSPKVLVNYPGSGGSSRHDWKIVDWDVKPQHKQTKQTTLESYTLFHTCSSEQNCWAIYSRSEPFPVLFLVISLAFKYGWNLLLLVPLFEMDFMM